MVNIEEIRAYMGRENITKGVLAKELHIAPKTLMQRFEKRAFYTDEVEKLVKLLKIEKEKIVSIFFDGKLRRV